MPRSPEQNAVIRDKRRNKILEKTLKLFAYEGYDDISVDDITRAVNCSHGLFYHYFVGKEDVYNALLELKARKYSQYLAPMDQIKKEGGMKGLMLLAAFFEDLQKAPDNALYFEKLTINEDYQMKRADESAKKENLFPTIVKLVKKAQADGEARDGKPEELAHAFIDVVNGAIERRLYAGAEGFVALSKETIISVIAK